MSDINQPWKHVTFPKSANVEIEELKQHILDLKSKLESYLLIEPDCSCYLCRTTRVLLSKEAA